LTKEASLELLPELFSHICGRLLNKVEFSLGEMAILRIKDKNFPYCNIYIENVNFQGFCASRKFALGQNVIVNEVVNSVEITDLIIIQTKSFRFLINLEKLVPESSLDCFQIEFPSLEKSYYFSG